MTEAEFIAWHDDKWPDDKGQRSAVTSVGMIWQPDRNDSRWCASYRFVKRFQSGSFDEVSAPFLKATRARDTLLKAGITGERPTKGAH